VRRFYDDCGDFAERLRSAQSTRREQARKDGWTDFDRSLRGAIRNTIEAGEKLTTRSVATRLPRQCIIRRPRYGEHFHDLLAKAKAGEVPVVEAVNVNS